MNRLERNMNESGFNYLCYGRDLKVSMDDVV
jgi:hypothetical protein